MPRFTRKRSFAPLRMTFLLSCPSAVPRETAGRSRPTPTARFPPSPRRGDPAWPPAVSRQPGGETAGAHAGAPLRGSGQNGGNGQAIRESAPVSHPPVGNDPCVAARPPPYPPPLLNCHPERSEGSIPDTAIYAKKILRCAQDDRGERVRTYDEKHLSSFGFASGGQMFFCGCGGSFYSSSKTPV